MTKDEIEIVEKKEKIFDLLADPNVIAPEMRYLDIDSNKLLDEKIAVLTALKEGKQIKDIPDFYKVLELLPEEGQIWD